MSMTPSVGLWYQNLEGELLEVVAFDPDEGTIEVQFYDGTVEEYDLGVVQHRAPDSRTDAWADGSHGYLKMEAVVAMFEDAGFEFLAESSVNANPLDDLAPPEEEED